MVSYATLVASRRDLRTISLVVGQVSQRGEAPAAARPAAGAGAPRATPLCQWRPACPAAPQRAAQHCAEALDQAAPACCAGAVSPRLVWNAFGPRSVHVLRRRLCSALRLASVGPAAVRSRGVVPGCSVLRRSSGALASVSDVPHSGANPCGRARGVRCGGGLVRGHGGLVAAKLPCGRGNAPGSVAVGARLLGLPRRSDCRV